MCKSCCEKEKIEAMHEHEHEHEHCQEELGDVSCGCGHSHGDGSNFKWTVCRLSLALIMLIVVYFTQMNDLLRTLWFLVAYLLAGYDVLLLAVKNIMRGKIFDENFLMSIASIGAFVIDEKPEAVAVMIFYGVGELLQNGAVAKSKKNIAKLMDLNPDYANLKRDGQILVVAPETVKLGEIIVVKAGEKIPMDGVIVAGSSFIDTKALTGESVPRSVGVGKQVLSGSLNLDGVLEVKVEKIFAESTVSKILELMKSASQKKAQSEKFITKFARYYTPAVVGVALVVAVIPPLFASGIWADWIYKALCFLIISCPCALVLSIPLSFFGGIGGAARLGVLVKGGNYLELLEKLGTIVFDKTGTLTRGVFEVTAINAEAGVTAEELLHYAALAENNSNHPIAKSILKAYNRQINESFEVREVAGCGVIAKNKNYTIYAGNSKLMAQIGIKNLKEYAKTTVHIALNDKYLGSILIADQLKVGVKDAIKEFHALGVARIVMLTGDNSRIAAETACELAIDEYKAELMPQDKVAEIEKLIASELPNKKTAFVGDGINDAPVLMRADLGIAMGGIGSDAAIEAADVVVMTDDIRQIAKAIRVARKTKSVVIENIVMALGFKLIIMLLALLGYASVWFAIFADVGVALLALANALRVLKN